MFLISNIWKKIKYPFLNLNFSIFCKKNSGKQVISSLCCYSVAKSCPILCDPMDCSMPGFPVLYYLLEFAQTHINVNLKGRVTETKQGAPRELCLQHIKEKKKKGGGAGEMERDTRAFHLAFQSRVYLQ